MGCLKLSYPSTGSPSILRVAYSTYQEKSVWPEPLSEGKIISLFGHVEAEKNDQKIGVDGYVLNNPLKYTDPDGELAFLAIGAILLKGALIGAAVNGGMYAVSTAVTGQKFDIGQFGRSLAVGAISGVASAGAGALSSAFMSNVYGAVPGALIKGAIQGTAGAISGGLGNVIMSGGWGSGGSNFWKGAGQGFATGFLMGAVSGGMEGYKNAQRAGANPWSGKLYSNERTYSAAAKNGVALQPNSERDCYGYALEYADSGHGNHDAAYFLDRAGNAAGADAGQVARAAGINVNYSLEISGSQWDNVGGQLLRGHEILGTTSRTGVNHWVNFTRIVTADKWKIIGGGWKRVLQSTSVWDPSSGHVANGPNKFFSVVSLF